MEDLMAPETPLNVLEETAWPETESPRPVVVTFDEESNALVFHEGEGGAMLYEWIAERRDGPSVADLFVALSGQEWATKEVLQESANVIREVVGRMPGHVTLQEELASILRANGNRWMTPSELAAEVNRRGRHWKAYRNRITAATVLGRTKLYARTFERLGERVRLSSV
jgi:hypothetical protein